MAVNKRFSKELYQKYDALAKEATKLYYHNQGYSAVENTERYRQDLVVDAPQRQHLGECEVKLVWKTFEFPYDTVQLPKRKSKFFDQLTQFFIWNHDLTRAATFWSNEISDLEPVEVPNKYVYKGEYFYQIPLERVTFVELQHNLELPQ